MKVYRCDSCGLMVEDPHSVCMKEFTYREELDEYGIWKLPLRRKTEIHLCSVCFGGLRKIAEQKLKGENNDKLI